MLSEMRTADHSALKQTTNENNPQRKQTHIICIRHGETDFNKTGKIQGQVDVAQAQLNSEGKHQAHQVGCYFSQHYPNIFTIYSSANGRAKETAKIINDVLNGKLSIVGEGRISTGLMEIRHGPYDATTFISERNKACLQEYARLRQEKPSDEPLDRYFYWKTNPITKVIPKPEKNEFNQYEYDKEPETVFELYTRSMNSLNEIIELHGDREEPIVITGHGGLFVTWIDSIRFQDSSEPIPVFYGEGAAKVSNCEICHFYFDHQTKQLRFEKKEIAK